MINIIGKETRRSSVNLKDIFLIIIGSFCRGLPPSPIPKKKDMKDVGLLCNDIHVALLRFTFSYKT